MILFPLRLQSVGPFRFLGETLHQRRKPTTQSANISRPASLDIYIGSGTLDLCDNGLLLKREQHRRPAVAERLNLFLSICSNNLQT